jgi:hypothetical protein
MTPSYVWDFAEEGIAWIKLEQKHCDVRYTII